MTPKLTRPYIIQPTANGIALFPAGEKLDFSTVKVFTDVWDFKTHLVELLENGESPQTPLDTLP